MVEATGKVHRKLDLIDTAPRFTETDAIRLNNLFRGTDTLIGRAHV